MDHNYHQVIDTGGRTLSKADRQFIDLLMRELRQFQQQAPKDRALMFHPLRGYERYLIHKATETFPKLTSFSIGDDQNRRTVVCFKSKRKEQQMQLGQMSSSPVRRPSSKVMSEEKQRGRSKTMEPSTSRGKPRNSASHLRDPRKFHTLDNDAIKKRERGLKLEGNVVNGEDMARSDVEGTAKNKYEMDKKYRTRRSLSQPHLPNNHRPRRRQDSFGDSTDQQNSDNDHSSEMPRHRETRSTANTPSRRHSNKPSVRSSRPESRGMLFSELSDGDNVSYSEKSVTEVEDYEVPPSYEKTSDDRSKSKAKRNLSRIKRSNSTRSCPPLEQPKRDYVNINSDSLKNAEYHDSPTFPRRSEDGETSLAGDHKTETLPKTDSKSRKHKRSRSRESTRSHRHSTKETPKAENVNSISELPTDNETTVQPSITDTEEMGREKSHSAAPSASDLRILRTKDSETQTDLIGSVVDSMMVTYNALSNFSQPRFSAPNPVAPMMSQSSASQPVISAPTTSAYEKLGEDMYKAMLNFQKMMGQQEPFTYRPPKAPESGTIFTPIAVPPPAPSVYVPLMSPLYSSHVPANSQISQCSDQQSSAGEPHCVHYHHTDSMTSRSTSIPACCHNNNADFAYSKQDKPSRERPRGHHAKKYSSGRRRSSSSPSHQLHSSKGPDGFESDVSSEVAITKVDDGVIAYVRNASNRSSSAGGSIGGSTNVSTGDARASPLDHDYLGSGVKKRGNVKLVGNKKSNLTEESIENFKDEELKKKDEDDMLAFIEDEVSPGNAPIVRMDDIEADFKSVASSYSCHSNNDDSDNNAARSLVGEDLAPVVCFDDNLEMACDDGTSEE